MLKQSPSFKPLSLIPLVQILSSLGLVFIQILSSLDPDPLNLGLDPL